MSDHSTFRQHLDTVLRTCDVKQVSAFLIAEKQWSIGQPADPEFAMWMMIAGNPTLRDLHERAYEWLMTHEHEEDAKLFLARNKPQKSGKQGQGQGKRGGHSKRPPQKR